MSTYDAYEVHECQPGNYIVTLVNTVNGARCQISPVVCGRQAHAAATRHGERAMTFLGVTKMRLGQKIPTLFPADCAESNPAHTHVHRFPLPVTAKDSAQRHPEPT